jgi:hypothetical protein
VENIWISYRGDYQREGKHCIMRSSVVASTLHSNFRIKESRRI